MHAKKVSSPIQRRRACIMIMFLWITNTQATLEKLYFATSADSEFYSCLLVMINSIYTHHAKDSWEITVYDLGLTPEQRAEVTTLPNVHVDTLEQVNPYMLTPFLVRQNGRTARGYYSWKPVALKMALDKYPYCMYIDCGLELQVPLHYAFSCIERDGYFFAACSESHPITIMSPPKVIELFSNDFEKYGQEVGISAGYQGISGRIYKSYILPIYELAKNIEYFQSDPGCPGGFNYCRNDQPLFSIMVRKLGFKVHSVHYFTWLTKRTHGKKDLETLCDTAKKELATHGFIPTPPPPPPPQPEKVIIEEKDGKKSIPDKQDKVGEKTAQNKKEPPTSSAKPEPKASPTTQIEKKTNAKNHDRFARIKNNGAAHDRHQSKHRPQIQATKKRAR